MRWTSLGLVAVAAACGDNGDSGALLTVVAVDGPDSATRIELVLANASSDTIETADQRAQAGDLAQEEVRYYRQRAIAGEVKEIDRVDGFRVRIEPNEELVTERDLIPFLIAFDKDDHISGIGWFADANGEPDKIEIRADVLRVFEITMAPMTETAGEGGIGTGEVLTVSCQSVRSGLAFQPGGVQLRLLLPDPTRDGATTDASERELDMDCDGAVALVDDCDDLRGEFHRGAVELCDGMDHDCDFRRLELVTCGGLSSTCGETEGVQLCVDTADGQLTNACVESPACTCAANPAACDTRCVLTFDGPVGDGAKTMCDPQLDPALPIPGCGASCTVEVLDRPNDEFRADIALENDLNFTTKLTSVPGKLQLRVRHVGVNPVTAGAGLPVGSVFLAVTPATTNVAFQIPIALVLEGGPVVCGPDGADLVCVIQP
jgi:hypothetical protein